MLSPRPKITSAAAFATLHYAISTPRFPRSVLGAASNNQSLSQGVARSRPHACINAKPRDADDGTTARFCLNRSPLIFVRFANRDQVALYTHGTRDGSDCLVRILLLDPPSLFQSVLYKPTLLHKPYKACKPARPTPKEADLLE